MLEGQPPCSVPCLWLVDRHTRALCSQPPFVSKHASAAPKIPKAAVAAARSIGSRHPSEIADEPSRRGRPRARRGLTRDCRPFFHRKNPRARGRKPPCPHVPRKLRLAPRFDVDADLPVRGRIQPGD
ncbi:hypothetical protein MTO96_027093 [Rhipicephalus appendiculatus]